MFCDKIHIDLILSKLRSDICVIILSASRFLNEFFEIFKNESITLIFLIK